MAVEPRQLKTLGKIGYKNEANWEVLDRLIETYIQFQSQSLRRSK